MSGLRTFVGGREGRLSTPPPPAQHIRPDRVAAAALKITSRDLKKSSLTPQKISNTPPEPLNPANDYQHAAPEPYYPPNGYQPAVPQPLYPSNSYQSGAPPPYIKQMRTPLLRDQQQSSRESLDDTTITSNFDKTLSDIHFEQALNAVEPVGNEHSDSERNTAPSDLSEDDFERPDHAIYRPNEPQNMADVNRYQQDNEYNPIPIQSVPPHSLRRQREGSPSVSRQTPPRQPTQPSGIAGRFSQSQSFPIRANEQEQLAKEQFQPSRKRSRSPEALGHRGREQQLHQPDRALHNTFYDTRENGRNVDAEDMSKTASPDRTPRRTHLPRSSQPASSQRHLIGSQETQAPAQPVAVQGIVADHDDETLKGMTYAQVEADSWEFSSNGRPPPESSDDRALEHRLEEIVSQTQFGEDNPASYEFFLKLSTKEWEESGDWFVDRFAGLMGALKEKRRKIRSVTEKYETELRDREKIIKGQSDGLDTMFKDMRRGGEDMLRGKI